MADVVLDASAVIAVLRGERGGQAAAAHMTDSKLSAVNLIEVAQRLNDEWSEEQVTAVLAELPCKVIDFDAPLGLRAGLMRRATRARGLSLGDRACLALAESLSLPVLTADRAWADLDLGIEVVLIR